MPKLQIQTDPIFIRLYFSSHLTISYPVFSLHEIKQLLSVVSKENNPRIFFRRGLFFELINFLKFINYKLSSYEFSSLIFTTVPFLRLVKHLFVLFVKQFIFYLVF